MRVIVLGGAGEMGSFAVEELAHEASVTHVTIADRDRAAAESLARRLANGGAELSALAVDATDPASLVAALGGHDVAASCIGPFHRFEARCARAAIDAGVDYVSICDEWQASEAVYALDGDARAAGVRVLTGMGASPGITNIGAELLAAEFDEVSDIDVYVYQPLDAGGGLAVVQHVLWVMSQDVAVLRDGRPMRVRGCSEVRDIAFPGHGTQRMWIMGHPEPFTLPKTIAARNVNFWMGFGGGSEWLVRATRSRRLMRPRGLDAVARVALWLENLRRPPEPGAGAVRVDVRGTIDGREETRTLCGPGTMRRSTGLALAIGARMLGDGTVDAPPGVHSPEGVVPARAFLDELATHGIASFRDIAMERPV